jgi:hypothetical protein
MMSMIFGALFALAAWSKVQDVHDQRLERRAAAQRATAAARSILSNPPRTRFTTTRRLQPGPARRTASHPPELN